LKRDADDAPLVVQHEGVEDVFGLPFHAHACHQVAEPFGQERLNAHHQEGGGGKRQREAQCQAQRQAGCMGARPR
jgi:hypothetical protein